MNASREKNVSGVPHPLEHAGGFAKTCVVWVTRHAFFFSDLVAASNPNVYIEVWWEDELRRVSSGPLRLSVPKQPAAAKVSFLRNIHIFVAHGVGCSWWGMPWASSNPPYAAGQAQIGEPLPPHKSLHPPPPPRGLPRRIDFLLGTYPTLSG